MAIRDNLAAFLEQLNESAVASGRQPRDITIMAVSKTRSIEEIIEARQAGLTLFGENRVEEASGKFADLDPGEYPLVLIGHLQSNKATRIDGRYSAVHSVDTVKIARRLSAVREAILKPLDVLIQVNTSGEDSKSGFRERQSFLEAAQEIAGLPYLELRGVMTMAPFVDDEKTVRECFARCRRWADEIGTLVRGPVTVSMGMSSDFRWAVAEGSTMLRIGTTIFGAR